MSFDFGVFVRLVTKPKEEIPVQLPRASFAKGAKIYFAFGAILGFFVALIVTFMAGLMSGALPVWLRGIAAPLGLLSLVVFPLLFGALEVVFSVVSYGILFLIAKLLGGGTASFGQFYCLFALLAVPMAVLSIVATMIPFLGIVLSLLVMVYAFYLGVQVYKAVFHFTTLRAVVAYVVVPVLLALVLAFLVAGALVAMVLPLMGAR